MTSLRGNFDSFIEYTRLKHIRTYVHENQELFTAGNEIPFNILLEEFEIPSPEFNRRMSYAQIVKEQKRYDNRIAAWQNRINRVLAQRGMYLTKRMNENTWYVRTNTEVDNKVQVMRNDARSKQSRANELERGKAAFGNSATIRVSDIELQRIIASSDPRRWHGTDWNPENYD